MLKKWGWRAAFDFACYYTEGFRVVGEQPFERILYSG